MERGESAKLKDCAQKPKLDGRVGGSHATPIRHQENGNEIQLGNVPCQTF